MLENCKLKLKTIACPTCHDKNLYTLKHRPLKVAARRAIIFDCLCQSCMVRGSIIVHEVLPEELAKVKEEQAKKLIIP